MFLGVATRRPSFWLLLPDGVRVTRTRFAEFFYSPSDIFGAPPAARRKATPNGRSW